MGGGGGLNTNFVTAPHSFTLPCLASTSYRFSPNLCWMPSGYCDDHSCQALRDIFVAANVSMQDGRDLLAHDNCKGFACFKAQQPAHTQTHLKPLRQVSASFPVAFPRFRLAFQFIFGEISRGAYLGNFLKAWLFGNYV